MPIFYRRAITRGSSREEVEFRAKIAARLGASTSITPIGRARTGIYLLGKFAMRGRRRKVLMSPFTIPDVVTMVILAGAEPVFFDFEPDSTACQLDALAAQIDDETACVLITHYHVNEPRLMQIAELCRERGVYLFDDCAISFGGSIDGRPVGTLTDASVFSLSSFKLLNFFWGGMITTRDPDIAKALEKSVAEWPRLSFRDYIVPAQACLKYDLASSPPLFGWLVFPLLKRRLKSSAAAGGLEHLRIETDALNPTLTSRPSLAAFAEWVRKLDRVDEWLAHRRAIARIYRQRLGKRMVSADTPEAALNGACFVNFPVIVPAERCTELCRAMMLSGFDVGRSLYPNSHRHPKLTSISGRSENVDRLVASTIYLPTHFGVSPAYADEIAARLVEEIG
jgi:dTDP-4-amino-4,6-dideoxygalactose transaminase